ncbi:hypothetical protein SEA_JACOREN57_67 [Mycobacterium phage JacoRen57]|nr:hypothetical protein SEA_JACOREN57_67 [Mycobacterium phage JacoRen57]
MKVTTTHGHEALHDVSNLTFLDHDRIRMIERTGGYDVDGPRPGRYVNENETTYPDMMWAIVNHVAFYGADGITSSITGDPDFCRRNAEWLEIRITLPTDDPESFGTVFTITHK